MSEDIFAVGFCAFEGLGADVGGPGAWLECVVVLIIFCAAPAATQLEALTLHKPQAVPCGSASSDYKV